VLSVDESGRPLLHADMLPARYAGLRDQVRDPAESWPMDAARIRIAEAAGAVAAIGHQVLGAIGFTDEHPLHRLTTRLWAWREEYGNHAIWSERLGSVLAGKDGLTLWQRMTR
jgi:alkylation response protein AidB-like acyl-CoA dehydrogenase